MVTENEKARFQTKSTLEAEIYNSMATDVALRLIIENIAHGTEIDIQEATDKLFGEIKELYQSGRITEMLRAKVEGIREDLPDEKYRT